MTTRLDRYLRTLHGQGYWIDRWYPLDTRAEFECGLTNNPRDRLTGPWGCHADALEALAIAMRSAGLPTEDWDEDTEADNPDDLAAAATFYDQLVADVADGREAF